MRQTRIKKWNLSVWAQDKKNVLAKALDKDHPVTDSVGLLFAVSATLTTCLCLHEGLTVTGTSLLVLVKLTLWKGRLSDSGWKAAATWKARGNQSTLALGVIEGKLAFRMGVQKDTSQSKD